MAEYKRMNRDRAQVDIAYAISSMVVGGAERQLLMLLAQLDRTKYRPWVLTLYPGPWDSKLEELEIELVTPPLGLSRLQRFLFLRNLLACRKPRILHCVGTTANIWIRLAACLAGVADIIVSIRNDPALDSRISRIIDRFLARFTSAAIVNAEHIGASYGRQNNLLKSRIHVIRNGLSPHTYEGAPIEHKHFRIGMAAGWRPQKNPELHMAVALNLAHDPLLRFEFAVAGDGPSLEEMKNFAKRGGIESRVRFLSWVEDMPRFLKEIDLLLHLPHFEGMPNIVMEAMASGLPCVVSDIAGNIEIVCHGKTGLVVPEDAVAAADIIRAVIGDPGLARALGSAAHAYATKEFSPSRMIQRTSNIYDSVLITDAAE